MAEKRKYNSKLNAKGLESSVSEEQARHMADNQGHTYLFLVKAHSGPKRVDEDGSESVNLIVDQAELVPERFEGRVADFTAALYAARPEGFGQEAFEDTSGAPDADAAADAIDSAIQRGEDGAPTGVWDGDPDAPVDSGATCLYPGCVKPDGHEGDHEVPDPADETDG